MTEIGTFILGCKMKFEELKDKAEKRMFAMRVLRENPIAVLDAIYSVEGIDQEDKNSKLRLWARCFLRKRDPKTKELNAFVLSRLAGQWTADFENLQKTHRALGMDYRTVFEVELLSRVLETLKLGIKTDLDQRDKKSVKDREDLSEKIDHLKHLLTGAMYDPATLLSIRTNVNSPGGVPRASLGLNRGYHQPPPEPLGPYMKSDLALSKAEAYYLDSYFPSVAKLWHAIVDEQEKMRIDIDKKAREKKEKEEKVKKKQQEKEKKEKADKKKKKQDEKDKKEKEEREKKQKEKEERERKENEERERRRRVDCRDGGLHVCFYCNSYGHICTHDGRPCVLCHPDFIHFRAQTLPSAGGRRGFWRPYGSYYPDFS